jgi:hypothetical protein
VAKASGWAAKTRPSSKSKASRLLREFKFYLKGSSRKIIIVTDQEELFSDFNARIYGDLILVAELSEDSIPALFIPPSIFLLRRL